MTTFDPVDTPANPVAIREQARRVERLVHTVCGRGDNVNQRLRAIAYSFTDLIADSIRHRAGYNEQTWQAALEGLFWGATVGYMWADDVEKFKRERRNLIEEWNSEVESGFGVGTPQSDNLSLAYEAWDQEYRRRRDQTAWRLQTEFSAAWEELQEAARERGHHLSSGPTVELVGLYAEALPRAAMPVFAAHLGSPSHAMQITIGQFIAHGILPEKCRTMNAYQMLTYLREHPEIAQRLEKATPQTRAGIVEAALAQAKTPDEIRAAFEQATPADRQWLAILFPKYVGNLDGAPFSQRITANHVRIIAELEREEIKPCPEQDAGRATYYRSILDERRQILYFDPVKDGAIAELHGHIGPNTRNVGVLVPGTGTNLGNFMGQSDRGKSFVDATPDGSLAMIVWMGGDLPDTVPDPRRITNPLGDASFNNYAKALAPKLAAFSHEIRREIDNTAASDNNVMITVAGHSYGGAVVGLAEAHGLDADRVLHIASAGAGKGISHPSDYNNASTNPNGYRQAVDRYSMTAPGDPISHAQGKAQTGSGSISELIADFTDNPENIGHGADPDELDGVVRLDTGHYVPGNVIKGSAAHSGVFNVNSDAWNNMYQVFTGGEVKLYRELEYRQRPGSAMQGDVVPYYPSDPKTRNID